VFPNFARAATSEQNPSFYSIAPKLTYGDASPGRNKCCPRDGRLGCSYVDSLSRACKRKATRFVSWVWGYALNDVTSALESWCDNENLDPSDQFLWLCFFCNNQFRILLEQSSDGCDELDKVFGDRLVTIGKVLVIMDSWQEPRYIQRIWCVFESYMADRSGVPFQVILPHTQNQAMLRELQVGNLAGVIDAFGIVDVERAKASVKADEEKVKSMIQQNSGYDHVNTVVQESLLQWMGAQLDTFSMKRLKALRRVKQLELRFDALFSAGVETGGQAAELLFQKLINVRVRMDSWTELARIREDEFDRLEAWLDDLGLAMELGDVSKVQDRFPCVAGAEHSVNMESYAARREHRRQFALKDKKVLLEKRILKDQAELAKLELQLTQCKQ